MSSWLRCAATLLGLAWYVCFILNLSMSPESKVTVDYWKPFADIRFSSRFGFRVDTRSRSHFFCLRSCLPLDVLRYVAPCPVLYALLRWLYWGMISDGRLSIPRRCLLMLQKKGRKAKNTPFTASDSSPRVTSTSLPSHLAQIPFLDYASLGRAAVASTFTSES